MNFPFKFSFYSCSIVTLDYMFFVLDLFQIRKVQRFIFSYFFRKMLWVLIKKQFVMCA